MGDRNSQHYAGADAERILRRAAEIEGSATSQGFDLSELRQIAAEVGVSPMAVERAALELAPMPASRLARLAGGPASLRLESDLPGAVGVDDLSRVAEVIESSLGRSGRLERSPEGLVWRASDPYGKVVVRMTSSPEGGTRVRVTADRSGAVQMTWLLSGVGALLTAVALQNHVPGLGAAEVLGLWSASALGAGAVARGVWSRISHAWRDRLLGLVGQMRRLSPAKEEGEQA